MRDRGRSAIASAGLFTLLGTSLWKKSAVMSASALIAAVHRRRPLWDTADANHHNRLLINALWYDVGAELGMNMMLAKSKWRGLRDYYRQQLKRNSEQPEAPLSNWKHFNEMAFVGGTPNPRSSQIKEEFGTSPTDLDIHNAVDQEWQEDAFTQNWQSESVSSYKRDSGSSDEDDDLHFFKSIIPDLKDLERQKKVILRMKILKLIHEELYAGGKQNEASISENGIPPSPPKS
ncbi:uncharacterized protein LOC106665849 [Cimex lectularius]|uniref:MADF domain-containing protein n=1 Tax=Cimex lectularius TaxID=79782 RepID=A0A8I6RKJ8_CIMLE|nr:uncharacterized protein LOC106665849 [Cimex lectularius]